MVFQIANLYYSFSFRWQQNYFHIIIIIAGVIKLGLEKHYTVLSHTNIAYPTHYNGTRRLTSYADVVDYTASFRMRPNEHEHIDTIIQ